MSIAPGTRLGPYEIVAPLGAGGMGEVYRAHDSRLGRSVAIKVLPQHLSTNPEVRARFEREARTVSALNHPHICTLHDIGREGATDYLVMELVEGETLANRLERGPMPTAEVLRLGAQIADALDRAHRAGIVHRDLKPGNVMLTKSGAKLLDFGLARASGAGSTSASPAPAGLSNSPTIAQPLTSEGMLLGTFQYMSPEQLDGKEADPRADLWALGCVLYEMATGKRAFDGASRVSLISAIVRDSPRPMSELVPMSPPALERLVRQCLAKDPDERWQSAGDVRRELEWIASGASQPGTPVIAPMPARRRLSTGMLGIAAGVAIAAGALLISFGHGSKRTATPPLVRFDLDSPPGVTFNRPAEVELSPDGRMLVFDAADSTDKIRLYLRPFASRETRVVPGTEGASLPFWSPDSRFLGFFADGKLRKVALDGSAPVTLCDAPDGRGGAWSPSGEIVFAPSNSSPLARVSAAGGAPTALTQLDKAHGERGHRYPQFLPDGKHLLYVAIGGGEEVSTYAIPATGGERIEVCRAGSEARYAEPGWLLFLDSGVNSPQRRLLARRFDPARLRTSGDGELLLDRVHSTNFGYAGVTTSGGGTLIVQHWEPLHGPLIWRDRRGAMAGVAIADFDGQEPVLSPDGSRLAYGSNDPQDLFVRDLATGVATRLTFNNHRIRTAVWSTDGRTLAYSRLSQAHGWEIYTKAVDGSGPDSLLFHGPGIMSFAADWSRDGRWVVALCYDSTGQADLWRAPTQGGGRAEIYQRTPELESGAALSPDGHWLAYDSQEGTKQSILVQSFPDPSAKYQISITGAVVLRWSERGDALLAITDQGEIVSVAVTLAGGLHQGATTPLFKLAKGEFLVGIAPGEQRFLVDTVKDPSAATRLEIVFGWPQLLVQAK